MATNYTKWPQNIPTSSNMYIQDSRKFNQIGIFCLKIWQPWLKPRRQDYKLCNGISLPRLLREHSPYLFFLEHKTGGIFFVSIP
jgi:hypothetical protein